MKFLRQLAAVVLVVAVIIGLGLLWAHASGGGPGGGFRQGPPAGAIQPVRHIKGGAVGAPAGTDFHPSGPRLSSFDFGNTGDLIRTGEIEAILAAVVITVSAIRRRHRRRMRGAAARA